MDPGRLAAGVLHHPAPAAAPVAHAAAELARYLAAMTGRTPALRGDAGRPGSWLHLGATVPGRALAPPVDAEAVVRPGDEGVTVVATSPRALLAAVYALLEAVGCRWSPYGSDEERVPVGTAVGRVPELRLRPSFARRAWAADLATWHYSMPDRLAARLPGDVAFVDWMAKSGATGFLFIRHANDTQWVVPELARALAARGLELEGGGHALVELLPRALHGAHPEYFPVGPDGSRTDLGNVCASNRDARGVIAANARSVCDELGLADLHLWGLDLFGGGWCRCPACAPLSPSEQALLVANDAADRVAGRVYHLAYHDTIPVPRTVRPHARVWAEFAPRERCYGHSIGEPACATNAGYHEMLARHLDHFDGRVDVFEYYADSILFGGCAVPLTEVIAADLDCYRRMGVAGVSCLTFGRHSLWAYGPNVEAFARAASGRPVPSTSPGVRALERLMANVVTYGDILLPPDAPEVRAALDAVLAQARAVAAERPADPRLLDYTFAAVTAVRDWLAATLDHPPGATRAGATDRALAALTAAATHVRDVDEEIAGTWGKQDLEITLHFFANALRARS